MDKNSIDSIWTQLSVILPTTGAVLAGIFGLYKYVKSRQHKEISFSIVSDTFLASLHESILSNADIKVLANDKQVKKIRSVVLRIRNSGNVAIKQEDFETKLWFLRSEALSNGTLVSAQISGAEPVELASAALLENDGELIGLNGLLLNGGDSIYINLLLADFEEPIKVYGRVVGVKEIKQETFSIRQPFNFANFIGQVLAFILFSLILGCILALPLMFILKNNYVITTGIITITILVIVLILFVGIQIKRFFRR